MNDVVIIDASIAMTRIRRQSGWEDVNARLAAWRTGGTSLLVPSHFWLEVSTVFLRHLRGPNTLAGYLRSCLWALRSGFSMQRK